MTRPFLDSSQLQTMPAATSGMTWGRNRTVREAVPSAPVATRRMSDATTSPSATGTTLKKTISLKALTMDAHQVGVGQRP